MDLASKDRDRFVAVLTNAVASLCRNGMITTAVARVEGLLGVTLETGDVFLVNIKEDFCSINQASSVKKNRHSCVVESQSGQNSIILPMDTSQKTLLYQHERLKKQLDSESHSKQIDKQRLSIRSNHQNSLDADHNCSLETRGNIRLMAEIGRNTAVVTRCFDNDDSVSEPVGQNVPNEDLPLIVKLEDVSDAEEDDVTQDLVATMVTSRTTVASSTPHINPVVMLSRKNVCLKKCLTNDDRNIWEHVLQRSVKTEATSTSIKIKKKTTKGKRKLAKNKTGLTCTKLLTKDSSVIKHRQRTLKDVSATTQLFTCFQCNTPLKGCKSLRRHLFERHHLVPLLKYTPYILPYGIQAHDVRYLDEVADAQELQERAGSYRKHPSMMHYGGTELNNYQDNMAVDAIACTSN